MVLLAAVGALAWGARYPNEWAKSGARLPDIDGDAATFKDLCDKTGLTLRRLEQYGREATQRGVNCLRGCKQFEYLEGRVQGVFRRVEPQWDSIDGTIPLDGQDLTERYLHGPIWKQSVYATCLVTTLVYGATPCRYR